MKLKEKKAKKSKKTWFEEWNFKKGMPYVLGLGGPSGLGHKKKKHRRLGIRQAACMVYAFFFFFKGWTYFKKK